jgi:hypothetical protein
MHRLLLGLFVCGAATFVLSQPPEDGGGKKKDGKGPPGFKVGKVFPRHIREAIELTDEQQRKIDDLEDEVRQKLEKILTVDQFRQAESMGPPPGGPGGPGGPPPGPPRDGPDGPPPRIEDGGPPRGKKGRPQDPPPAKDRPAETSRIHLPSGIQWFATWESGLEEATRTGKPILLASGTPHCAGVSGIWCPGKREMDHEFLLKPQVVAASRGFVCIRPVTYEDATEAALFKEFAPTGSGQLENTVFGILAPDGVTKLIRSSRSPDHAFSGPEQMAAAMTKIAARYANTQAPERVPLVASVRLAVNVAAADCQPLVVIVANDSATRKTLLAKLAPLAWSDELIGKFVFAAGGSGDLSMIEGAKPETGFAIVAPETFGRSAKVLATADGERIAEALRGVAATFLRVEKTNSHVRAGHQQGVFWETAVPVTDPMELDARTRGKKKS